MASRFWMFTEFKEDNVLNWENWFKEMFETNEFTFIIGQPERCPDTDKIHIQGYVILKKRKRLNSVKKVMNSNSIYLDKRKGSHDQAVAYCSKVDTQMHAPLTLGEYNRGNGASNLDAVKADLDNGDSIRDIADNHWGIYSRYRRAIEKYVSLVQNDIENRNFKTEVRVYFGVSGAGKTTDALKDLGDNVYIKNSEKWWDGYNGTDNIFIGEFKGWLPMYELKLLLGDTAIKLQRRGLEPINARPKLIIITSQSHPEEWYPNASEEDLKAIMRRIDHLREYSKPHESINTV